MLKSFFASLAVVGLTLATTSQATTAAWRPTVIQNVQVTPTNGGINPDAFAYRIKGKVMAGSNPCEARGVQLSFSLKRERGNMIVTPVRKSPRGQRICTREFRPVYLSIETTIRGLQSQTTDVIIANVDELGNRTSLSELLDGQSSEVTVTGILTRVMAIGGETTGYALYLDNGETVEVDLQTNNLDRGIAALDGEMVKVTGKYKTVRGVEIPTRQVLEAEAAELAQ